MKRKNDFFGLLRWEVAFNCDSMSQQGPCFRERIRLYYVLKVQEYHLTLETIE